MGRKVMKSPIAAANITWNKVYTEDIPLELLEHFGKAVTIASENSGARERIIRSCILCCIFQHDFVLTQTDLTLLSIESICLIRAVLEVSYYGDIKFLITNFDVVFNPILKDYILIT